MSIHSSWLSACSPAGATSARSSERFPSTRPPRATRMCTWWAPGTLAVGAAPPAGVSAACLGATLFTGALSSSERRATSGMFSSGALRELFAEGGPISVTSTNARLLLIDALSAFDPALPRVLEQLHARHVVRDPHQLQRGAAAGAY